eukprot:753669-Hanusia_phi.AAC.2
MQAKTCIKLLRGSAELFLISFSLLLPVKTGAFVNQLWGRYPIVDSLAPSHHLLPRLRLISFQTTTSNRLHFFSSLRCLLASSLINRSFCAAGASSSESRCYCRMGKRKLSEESPHEGLVRTIQGKLQKSSDPKTKQALEQYLKGTLHRGNKMPAVKLAAEEAMKEFADVEAGDLEKAGLELVRSEFSDDKQAGILLLQAWVKRRRKCEGGVTAAEVDAFLSKMVQLFESNAIADWSSSDNLCGKVLGPFVLTCKADVRRQAVKRILGWSQLEESTVWQRRAGHVTFVTHVSPKKSSRAVIGDELHYNGFVKDLIAACEMALRISSERFSNTGAGWVLRYCYHLEREETVGCLDRCAPIMTREGINYALEQCKDAGLKQRLIEMNREGPRG